MAKERDGRQRMATVFGFLAGGSLALLVNYVISLVVGPGYPVQVSTFVACIAGAFGGMAVADRLGRRAFPVLAVSAGILLAVALVVLSSAWLGGGVSP